MDKEKIYCWFCEEEILKEEDMTTITISDKIHYVHKGCKELSTNTNHSNIDSKSSIKRLSTIAWINLVIGIIGAIAIWSTMGTMEVPYNYIPGTHTETNPLGIALGFATLFGSILAWAFLSVVCDMAENLIEIRNSLKKV